MLYWPEEKLLTEKRSKMYIWRLLSIKKKKKNRKKDTKKYAEVFFYKKYSQKFIHNINFEECSVQFSHSVVSLCDPMNRNTPGLPVHHQLPESTQTHVHCVGDAIQPSHPLSSPSSPAFNLSEHQGLFKWVSSPHQVAKVLEFQLQHQPLQWTSRTDLL